MRSTIPALLRTLQIAGVAATITLGGCYGYSSWPPVEGDTAVHSVNISPVPVVMGAALKFVADRYPPVVESEPGKTYADPFAISLPPGASINTYFSVAANTGPAARPLIEGDEKLPIYHVARVNVRGTSATVDIIRPVVGVAGKPADGAMYQAVTVYLSSGVSPWHVTYHRTLPMGMLEVPAPNPLPAGSKAPYSG